MGDGRTNCMRSFWTDGKSVLRDCPTTKDGMLCDAGAATTPHRVTPTCRGNPEEAGVHGNHAVGRTRAQAAAGPRSRREAGVEGRVSDAGPPPAPSAARWPLVRMCIPSRRTIHTIRRSAPHRLSTLRMQRCAHAATAQRLDTHAEQDPHAFAGHKSACDVALGATH